MFSDFREVVSTFRSATYHIEEETGYLDEGEVWELVKNRIRKWAILFGALFIIIYLIIWLIIGIRPNFEDIIITLPGTFGAGLLAYGPLRSDNFVLHKKSGDAEGVKRNTMSGPIIQDYIKITDRTFGLILIGLAFSFQLIYRVF